MSLNVSSLLSKVKLIYVIRYVAGLMLSPERKTCTKISKLFGVSHDTIYQFLLSHEKLLTLFPQLLVCIAKHFNQQKKGWLIFDDTGISKRFSKFIEGATQYYNASENRLDYGMSLVVVAWSNGNITIPVGYSFWYHKDVSQGSYKKKCSLAQDLVLECIKNNIYFEYVVADGLYFSREMVEFFQKSKIKFEMRAHANRSIVINDIKQQLKLHPHMRLQKNQRSKTVNAYWYGHNLFFTTVKRKDKHGEYSIVYQVSNMNRTAKQKLGLAHCAARSLNKQKLHVYAVFAAYAYLEIEKIETSQPNPESVVSHLQSVKLDFAISRITSLIRNFAYVA